MMHCSRPRPLPASVRSWVAALVILAAVACGGGGGDTTPPPPPPPALAITAVVPPQGARAARIKISGPGVGQAAYVLFGTWYAAFTKVDADAVEAKVPYYAGTAKITVRTSGGKEAVSKEDFKVLPPGTEAPVLDAIAPLQGAPGLQVTLTGTGLDAPTAVTFGGVAASFPVTTSPTKLVVKVPPHAQSGPVAVATAHGTTRSRETFTVLAEGTGGPVLHSVFPVLGPVGTPVTLNGEGFQQVTRVEFAGTAAVLQTVEQGRIETQVPAGAATGPLTLADAGGHVVQAGTFTVTAGSAAASITSFEPETGAPGTLVILKGTGVGTASEVRLGPLKLWRYPWGQDELGVFLRRDAVAPGAPGL